MSYVWLTLFFFLIARSHETLNKDQCNQPIDPVCGTNGMTYKNLCHLQSEQSTNPTIGLQHKGKCVISLPNSQNRRTLIEGITKRPSNRKQRFYCFFCEPVQNMVVLD